MLALVFGAVRTRAAQVLTILVLTALAAAVAAAGPWYGFAAAGRAAGAYLEAAPAIQKTVTVAGRVDTRGDPDSALRRFSDEVRAGLPAGVGAGVGGMTGPLNIRSGAASVSIAVAYRDRLCEHLRLEGACPTARGDVAISQETAQRLGAEVGDVLPVLTFSASGPLNLRVVAVYTLADPAGTYWSNRLYRSGAAQAVMFTGLGTFTHGAVRSPTMAYDVVLPDAMLRGDEGFDLNAAIAAADRRLGQTQLRLNTLSRSLHDAVVRDRETILRGVTTAGAQMVILTWFAVGLAGWFTLRDRRGDAALLKLRGVSRLGMLRLTWGQHLVPLVLGVLVGAPVGFLVARLLTGPVTIAPDREAALIHCAAATGAVLAGSLAVLAAVEAAVLGRPVSALLARAGTVRGTWRPAVVDVLLLAVAGAAILQARSAGPADGLGPAAPALVALAVGLLAARLLGRAADRAGGAALRSGRLRTGLTVLRFSRSPGIDRVFALLVVAVAVFTTAAGGWTAERVGRAERSVADLGADRVLNVVAINRTMLLHAVRSVDPEGREAMAVVRNRGDDQETLEVDTTRLAAVAVWRGEYGPVAALPDAVAAATRPALPLVTGDRLTLDVRRDGPAPVALRLRLQHEATGAPVAVTFGTLRPGEQSVTVPLAGCTTAPGCRIVRWELTTPPDENGRADPPPAGASATLRELNQGDTETVVLDAATLSDISRWRAGTTGAALDLVAADGALRLAADPNSTRERDQGAEAWVAEALPLPALLAGPTPEDWASGEPVLGALGDPAPVRVLGTVTALPALGRNGLLLDLDTTRRFAAEVDPGGDYQVWLASGARTGLAADLTAAGLTVTGDATAAGYASRLGIQGPAVVVRFALVAGIAALLIAAATLAVAIAVDRRSLGEDLAALRAQGLSQRVAVSTGYAGTTALIVTGLAGGILAGLLATVVTGRAAPAFADGWAVLASPAPLHAGTVALASVAALVLLGLVGRLSLLPLIRALRGDRVPGARERG